MPGQDNIKFEGVTREIVRWRGVANTTMNLRIPWKARSLLACWTTIDLSMLVFWVVTPCGLVGISSLLSNVVGGTSINWHPIMKSTCYQERSPGGLVLQTSFVSSLITRPITETITVNSTGRKTLSCTGNFPLNKRYLGLSRQWRCRGLVFWVLTLCVHVDRYQLSENILHLSSALKTEAVCYS
jgi:hypothetical protein